jgi:uncharacterized membrane protein YfcA
MNAENLIFLTLLIFAAAALYSSVGHAGASGYLAAMALFDLAPEVMKPTALCLNVLVAVIAAFKFYRAGAFDWRVLLLFALPAVPFAFVGGAIHLPTNVYKPIVGAVLLFAAARFFLPMANIEKSDLRPIPVWAAILLGIFIGLLSGLTGVGGGIFLSPLLIFSRWAETRTTSGVSAMFILVNSAAGLLGQQLSTIPALPAELPFWAMAAIAGGFVGAEFGSRRLGNSAIRRLLAIVLIIAGVKMIFAA